MFDQIKSNRIATGSQNNPDIYLFFLTEHGYSKNFVWQLPAFQQKIAFEKGFRVNW